MTLTQNRTAAADDEERRDRLRVLRELWWRAAAYYLTLGLVSLLLARRAIGLDDHPISIPLYYNGDALSGGSSFKNTITTGWYEYNPDLGAPWGQHFHDFPLADNLHLIAARVLGWFTDDWAVAFNAYYLLTFPLAALSGAWFIRVIGGSRTSAFVFGLLFAFAPYHFVRNEGHLYLGAYYPVPLAAAVAYRAMAGVPLWHRRSTGHRFSPLPWLTWRSFWTFACLVVLGTASSYYSVFLLLLLAAVVIALLLQKLFRPLVGAIAAMVLLMVVMVINMAPDLLWAHGQDTNVWGLTRSREGTEVYSFKLSQLVLPVPWSRIGRLAAARQDYDRTFPLPSEVPVLGMVAAVGFLFLLAVVLISALRGVLGNGSADRFTAPVSEFWAAQRRLGFLTSIAFLLGTVGGLATLFTLLVSDSLRGWNRIAIYLSVFALASVALMFDRAIAWLLAHRALREVAVRPPLRLVSAALLGVVVLAGGVYDQVPPFPEAAYAAQAQQFRSDETWVRAIEAQVPAETMVFQLPYYPFPESPPVNRMLDSDDLRPYLHSTDLRWSYGGIKGRPRADWADLVSSQPVQRMLVMLGAAGFGGISVDRYGYTAQAATDLEEQLTAQLGVQPLVSPDQRFAFYDLGSFDARLRTDYPADELAAIGDRAVAHAVSYWQQDFGPPTADAQGDPQITANEPSPRLLVDNPQDAGIKGMDVSFVLRTAAPGPVQVTWPDGRVDQVDVPAEGLSLQRTLDLPAGRTYLGLKPSGALPANLGFSIGSFTLRDPVLSGFTVR